MRNTHYVAKEAKLLRDFVRLPELDKAKGVCYWPKLQQYFLSRIPDVEK